MGPAWSRWATVRVDCKPSVPHPLLCNAFEAIAVRLEDYYYSLVLLLRLVEERCYLFRGFFVVLSCTALSEPISMKRPGSFSGTSLTSATNWPKWLVAEFIVPKRNLLKLKPWCD